MSDLKNRLIQIETHEDEKKEKNYNLEKLGSSLTKSAKDKSKIIGKIGKKLIAILLFFVAFLGMLGYLGIQSVSTVVDHEKLQVAEEVFQKIPNNDELSFVELDVYKYILDNQSMINYILGVIIIVCLIIGIFLSLGNKKKGSK